jgi:hypothetical protein
MGIAGKKKGTGYFLYSVKNKKAKSSLSPFSFQLFIRKTLIDNAQ